ncbi:MAG: CoA transferase [Nevskiales bacterium]|nr:CoA transferase [Nevskiales bacterium]
MSRRTTTINPLLSGVRVIDLSRLLPGPFCTLYLAQLGAEIIKVEDPEGGDYARTLLPDLFAVVNRGKQSVALDLRKPEGVATLKRLVKTADVLLESFRPGVMDRLGCGYRVLKKENPRLVYAALTGYGQTGPYRNRPGHDMNYCGYTGALDQIGAAGGPPVLPNTQIADLAGGALTCAVGILAAVIGARRGGRGAFVDVAMADGTLALQVAALGALRAFGSSEARGAGLLTGALPNYSLYECADGKWFALGALEYKFWVGFCKTAGRSDLAQQPLARGKAGEPLRAQVAALFKSRTRDEWEKQLAHLDTCGSGLYTLEEALANQHLRARGMVETVGGKPAFASPVKILGRKDRTLSGAPKLGADTGRVLKNLKVKRK